MDSGATQIRVLGCLIEKQRTTPDQYPLSLNSLRLACNQSTNRDPVVTYDDDEVRAALGALGRRGWIASVNPHGGRALKYRHLLDRELSLDGPQISIVALLMLRGTQTPGELKQRAERLHAFGDLGEVVLTLEGLIERDLVKRLPRRPGQKEERYSHLIEVGEGEDDGAQPAAPESSPQDGSGDLDRLDRIEAELAELRAAIADLRGALPDEPDGAPHDAP